MSTPSPLRRNRPEPERWLARGPRRTVKSFELGAITSRRRIVQKLPFVETTPPPLQGPPTPPDGEVSATFSHRVPNARMAVVHIEGRGLVEVFGPRDWADVFVYGRPLSVRFDGRAWALVGQYNFRGIRRIAEEKR
jgi:hypothetical protein